jgi:hypothetical protein
MRRPLLAVVLLVSACAADDESFDDGELAEVSQEMISTMPQSPLDAPVGGQGVARMTTSQIVRLPTSWFFSAPINFSQTHRFRVKTLCSAAEPERRDSGLLVVHKVWDPLWGWSVLDVRYNDDSNDPSCPTCSRLDMGQVSSAATHRYEVHAFSNRRTKASCRVVYSASVLSETYSGSLSAPGWPSSTPMDLGGALVDVGAVDRNNDWFEVKTASNEPGGASLARENTRMILFDQQGRYVPAESLDFVPNVDRDPRIGPGIGYSSYNPNSICNNPPCAEPKHFLLIGREGVPPQSGTPAIADVETTVSLVRGPEDAAAQTATLNVSAGGGEQCGAELTVQPGRHSASVLARSNAPYGEANDDHDNACALIDPDTGPLCPTYYFRGNGNFRAFQMYLQGRLRPTDPWVPVTQTREVPNGVFGCGGTSGGCDQSLREDFEVYAPTSVRLCVANLDARIAITPQWTVARNPAGADVKVATLNIHHGPQIFPDDPGVENDAESRNLSNLLATRGRFKPALRTVVESQDDAPFEWGADVVLLQEHSWISSFNQFEDQASKTTDLDWHFVWGHSKQLVTYASYNSVFTHGLLVPPAGTIQPAASDLCISRISDETTQDDGFVECYNHDSADGGADYYTHSVPARLQVRRWGSGDVPILSVSVILEPGSDENEFRVDQRREELASLIAALKEYVDEHPEYVGVGADNVRILLGGDMNMYSHMLGENRWFVRELRAAFGYAVDAAAADRDSYLGFYDMHAWRGVSLTGPNGLPVFYTPSKNWYGAPSSQYLAWGDINDFRTWWWGSSVSWPHVYPYWAMTFAGPHAGGHDAPGAHDRHDGFFLVGRGWAKDDPVRRYIVMNTTAEFDEYNDASHPEPHGSPFAIRDAQGRVVAVDIEPMAEEENIPNIMTPGGPRHYKPEFDVTNDFGDIDGCTTNGCAAIETDHIPVGIRLRVTR